MAYESSAFVGSGISVLRQIHNVPNLRGSNHVLLNYEDVNSLMGILQTSGLVVGTSPVQLTGPENRLRGRRQVNISNSGTSVLFIGNSGVTQANGFPMLANTTLELKLLDFGNIWCVSNGVSSVRVLEIK